MMHSDLSITDGLYARMLPNEVGEKIASLGQGGPRAFSAGHVVNSDNSTNEELAQLLEATAKKLRKSND
jgi:hypothetical protein